MAYAEDIKGDEIYTVNVIDSEALKPVGEQLKGLTSYLEWAGNDALVYITMDEILRPDKVYLQFFSRLAILVYSTGGRDSILHDKISL